MMIAAAAARKQFTLVGMNLWQTGIRALFRFYMYKFDLTQDEAWANIRKELIPIFEEMNHEAEEWEYQLIRAILYEEHNITLKQGEVLFKLYPNSTPLLDAMRNCVAKVNKD